MKKIILLFIMLLTFVSCDTATVSCSVYERDPYMDYYTHYYYVRPVAPRPVRPYVIHRHVYVTKPDRHDIMHNRKQNHDIHRRR